MLLKCEDAAVGDAGVALLLGRCHGDAYCFSHRMPLYIYIHLHVQREPSCLSSLTSQVGRLFIPFESHSIIFSNYFHSHAPINSNYSIRSDSVPFCVILATRVDMPREPDIPYSTSCALICSSSHHIISTAVFSFLLLPYFSTALFSDCLPAAFSQHACFSSPSPPNSFHIIPSFTRSFL